MRRTTHHPALIALALALWASTLPAQQSLTPGLQIQATLHPGTANVYTVPGIAGQRVIVTVRSSDFVPHVVLVGPGGQDQAQGEGSATQVSLTLSQSGPSRITVTPARGGSGTFSIRAAMEATRQSVSASAGSGGTGIQQGDTRSGRLSAGDSRLLSGQLYDRYTFQGSAGQRVTITLRSTEFDAFLNVRTPSGGNFQDDDSAGWGNARVVLTMPETGGYCIDATSVEPGRQGSYQISVD